MAHESDTPSDAEIITRVIEADVNAFEILLKRYQTHVLKILKRHVPAGMVEETAQEVFIRAYQGLSNIQAKDRFRQWVSAIAVRTCYDYWRRRYRSREISMTEFAGDRRQCLENVLAEQADYMNRESRRQTERAELLDWARGKLSAAERMVFDLVYLEGLSGKEAASLLGWSVANVKVRTFRCRKKMKKMLSELMEKENDIFQK
jgi:RNA polymerase sigma-70 factor, ECF subfamily